VLDTEFQKGRSASEVTTKVPTVPIRLGIQRHGMGAQPRFEPGEA